MQLQIPGLQILYNKFLLLAIKYREGTPALYLDEMRIDASALASVNINYVALIKIFRRSSVGAFGGGAGGAIAVYTKDGDEEGTEK